MNVSVRLVVVAGAALVVAAVLAFGIYYLLGPAGSPPQAVSVPPPPQAVPSPVPHAEQRPAIGDSPTQPALAEYLPEGNGTLAPSTVSQAEPNLSLDLPAEGLETALPQTAATVAESTPTPNAVLADPIVVDAAVGPATSVPDESASEPMRDAPTVEAGQVAMLTGGKLQTPDPAPQTSGSGSGDQVMVISGKKGLKYPNLSPHLNRLVASVEEGQATAQKAAEGAAIHRGESVAVTIHLSGDADDVAQFLEDNGGDPRNVGDDYIEAYVPIALLGPVSEHPGVVRVREIVPPQGSQGNTVSSP